MVSDDSHKKITVLDRLEPSLVEAFKTTRLVALDVEGVDLGRKGKISLVQLSPGPERCFLLDMLSADEPLINWLRDLLESESVTKIVHDCRADSDALEHLLRIRLTRVHDTSCWHYKLTGEENVGLNSVLTSNGIRPNTMRDSRVYANNHAFWATRPLTTQMVRWAAGDVRSMFQVHARQTAKASLRVMLDANFMTVNHLAMARDARTDYVHAANAGAFIGRSGCNIRELQRKTNTLIYPRGRRDEATFLVYYHEDESLQSVREAATCC